ncbi:MAG TPA: GGDEF domain-containing protein [Steroidobacteraceae bacterium]
MGPTGKSDAKAHPVELMGPAGAAAEAALAARERAVLAREQAADRRDEAVLIGARLLHSESELREANERLVVAAVQAQTSTEAAERATALMSIRAERDFLTGLPNRAVLADRLAHSIELAQRHGTRVALMFVDLDNFKSVNDSLGHAVGDGLLHSTAKRLQACLRGSDTVSRQGGDEFLVLLTEVTSVEDTGIIADKLKKAMAEPHPIGNHQIGMTLSIGISLYPDDGQDVESLLACADVAMYFAKRSGRDTYRRFVPDMLADTAARRSP